MIKIVKNIKEADFITHSGTMHADEVFATAFLELYYKDIKVIRVSEIPTDINLEDKIVYDIGRGKFDHHQQNSLIRANGIDYSSFGLLWKEYGLMFLDNMKIDYKDEVFYALDEDLIEAIDGDDNGIFPKVECPYKIKTLSQIIKLFNPSFYSNEKEDEQFLKAVEVAKAIFLEELSYINGKIIAAKEMNKVLSTIDLNSKYIILDKYIPFEEAILDNETYNNILFVAFPSNRGGYAIKTIAKSHDDKTPRILFPEAWAGLVNEELEEVSNIEGLRFCHTGRFILTCKNLNSVMQVIDKLCK